MDVAESILKSCSKTDHSGHITKVIEPELNPASWADIDTLLGPIAWSWEGWLPDGFLTILAGRSGEGKSILALRIAACFLQGWNWPDGKPFTGEPGAIIWAESEASQAVNLERATSWGLPKDKIYTPLEDPLMDVHLPEHAGSLANIAMRPEVKLIVMDSLSGASRGNEDKSEQTIPLVKFLAELARDIKKPLILTHHLRKRSLFDTDTIDLDRLRGSSAIAQFARMIWALDRPDAAKKEHKRLSVIKSNLARFPDPIGMVIDEKGVSFGEAPESPRLETTSDRAIELLRTICQHEPQPYSKIAAEFEGAGISEATLKRTKTKLNIVSTKRADGWYWSLPYKE